MHGDDPVGLGIELVVHAWVLETDEGEGVAVGIGERDLGCSGSLARRCKNRMLYFDTLAMSAFCACQTSVFLGGLPSARRVLQHRVETAVGGHLGYALAEPCSQRAAG